MKISFYTLDDSNGIPFYVGKTKKRIETRLKEHISEAYYKNNAKAMKIKSMLNNNNSPTISELNTIFVEDFKSVNDMLNYSIVEENLWKQILLAWGFNLKNHIIDNNNNSYIGSIVKKGAKPVYMYNIDGVFVKKFNSSKEVLDLGFVSSIGNLNSVLNNKRKTCNNYIFSYFYYDKIELIKNDLETLTIKIHDNNGLIGIYSLSEIEVLFNIKRSNVYRYLSGERKCNNGLLFSLSNNSEYKRSKNFNGKPVLQYDQNNILVNSYKNLTEASKKLNVSKTAIMNSIKMKYYCQGYIFKYDL
jgi:predicted DNA-binding protein YlxM (UPF0122 family)